MRRVRSWCLGTLLVLVLCGGCTQEMPPVFATHDAGVQVDGPLLNEGDADGASPDAPSQDGNVDAAPDARDAGDGGTPDARVLDAQPMDAPPG